MSGPVLYAAAKMGIPTIIHEQNVIPGLTVKLLAKVVDVVAKLEQVAPLETQEMWDNSGWQINLGNKETVL